MLSKEVPVLSHEKLIVYQTATKLLALTTKVYKEFPKGYGDIVDQLRRASFSIPLNIAEGAGKSTKPDSGRFFAIARGSALECAAILDGCVMLEITRKESAHECKKLIFEIVCMLSKMCRPTP